MLSTIALGQDSLQVGKQHKDSVLPATRRDSLIQHHKETVAAFKAQKAALNIALAKQATALKQAGRAARDANYERGFWLGTNLLTMANLYEWGPSITLEYRANLHWAVGASYEAILLTGIGKDDPAQSPYYMQGFRFTANAKYFLPMGKSNRWFIGVEGRVKRLDYTVWRAHRVELENYADPYSYDSYYNQSPGYLLQPARTEPRTLTSWGITPVFGIEKMLSSRIQMELYFGLGICYRTLNTHGAPSAAREVSGFGLNENLVPIEVGGSDKAVYTAPWQVNMPLGLRVSYLLRKPKK